MEITKKYTSKLWIITLFLILLLVFIISFLNPKHADDYGYYLLGLSPEKHLNHYLTWSGRVIVDYVSATILQIDNKILMAILCSLAVPLLIYTIATIPNYSKTQKLLNLSSAITILFLTYWLTNPALGVSTFWIVGEVNYLWPILVFAIYIKYLLKTIHNTFVLKYYYLLMGILAFLAGCSNETTGITAIYVTFGLLLLSIYNKWPNKKLLFNCLVIAMIGYAILILAPGNYARASAPIFDDWRAMSFSTRIIVHITATIPNILRSYGIIYFILILVASYGWFYLRKDEKQLIILFTSAFILFCTILIASPASYKLRTYLTGIFLFWIILSFLLQGFFRSNKPLSKIGKLLLLIYTILFLYSYYLTFQAYLSLYRQEAIRIKIINSHMINNQQITKIPGFFKPNVLRKGDLPDLFYEQQSGIEMLRYYRLKSIFIDYATFNYEKVFRQDCSQNIQLVASKNDYIKCIFLDKKDTETTLIIEFNQRITKYKIYQNLFLANVSTPKDEKNNSSYSVNIPLVIKEIDNRYFAAINVVTYLIKENNPQNKLMITLKDKNNSHDITNYTIKIN